MAGLDLGALKDFDKDLATRTGEGNYLYQGKLSADGTDFRLAPPLPAMNGRYYIEVIKWWISGKPYISPETFGQPCPIQEEIDRNEGTKDKDLIALLGDADKLRKASEFLMPGWQLEPVGKNYDDFKVVGDKCTVLSCGVQLMKDINRIVTGRTASRIDSEDGITDRLLGYNLLLSKIGSGKNKTSYKAEIAEQFEMDEKYYAEGKIPNVIEMVEKQLKSDVYLEGVIANYLYGDAMPDDEKDDKPAAKAEEKPTGRGGASRRGADASDDKPARGGRASSAAEPEEKPEGRASRSTADKPAAGGGRRNLLSDLDD